MFNKIITTYKREGLFEIFIKARIRLRYYFLRNVIIGAEYGDKWKDLKNRYKGQRVFLLGNGPSLNKIPLHFLKDEYTMCFNRFPIIEERLNWFPNFYASVDNLVLDDLFKNNIELEYILDNVNYAFFPDVHFRGNNYIDQIEKDDKIYWLQQIFGRGFSTSLPKVYPGGSVIYEGFQILKYLGFDEIYFLGVDMNFKIHQTAKEINGNLSDVKSQDDDDPNHFDPRYFGKNKSYHQPKEYIINHIMSNLTKLSEMMPEYELNIINCGIDSNVKCFPTVKFGDLFNFSNKEKLKLINQCFSKNTSFSDLEGFLREATYYSHTHSIKSSTNFYTDADIGIKLISDFIFTHIPIGPHDNMYYFVNRNDSAIH